MPLKRSPLDHRRRWLEQRLAMETEEKKAHPRKSPGSRKFRRQTFRLARWAMETLGVSRLTSHFARRVRLKCYEFSFTELPDRFDGYRILHLTDPHFDRLPGLEEDIVAALPKQSPNLVVLTGDYRDNFFRPVEETQSCLRRVLEPLSPDDGVLAVLGNHDTGNLVQPLEEMGIRVLCNEVWTVHRGTDALTLVGLDDVHDFFTPEAFNFLNEAEGAFKVLLVHSNEAVAEAQRADYRLYLCGHTHGGQVCLPGGIPLLTHSDQPRKLSNGPWRQGTLQGLTSPGCGVVSLPVRMFCPPEITEITLKKA